MFLFSFRPRDLECGTPAQGENRRQFYHSVGSPVTHPSWLRTARSSCTT